MGPSRCALILVVATACAAPAPASDSATGPATHPWKPLAAAPLRSAVPAEARAAAHQPGVGAVNVRDLGAMGDGTTDDTAAIQAAIGIAGAAGGGTVVFPAGTYRVTSPIVVSRNAVDLVGSSSSASAIVGYGPIDVLQLGDGSGGTGGVTYTGVYGGSVRDLEIRAGDGEVRRGLLARGARVYEFRNVRVEAVTAGRGFSVAGVDIRESYVQRWFGGEVRGAAGHGYVVPVIDGFSNDLQFFGTSAVDCGGTGFKDGGGAGRRYEVYAEGNAGGGLVLAHVSGFSVRGTYYERNTLFDIWVTESAGGDVGGFFATSYSEDAHRFVWISRSSGVSVLPFHANVGDSHTGGVGIYLEPDNTGVSVVGAISAVGHVSSVGGPGVLTNASAPLAAKTGSNVALFTFESTGGADVGNGLVLRTNNANGAARNWALRQDVDAFGDLAVTRSAGKGGDPLAGDSTRVLYLSPDGRVQTGNGISPSTDGGAAQTGRIFQGRGAPSNANGDVGDIYFRTDAPGNALQRMYMKSGGGWVGIL